MKCKKGEYYCNDCEKCKPIPKGHHVMPNGDLMKDNEHIDEGGSLRNWFKGSKSKGGKPGWVQSDGSPCANEPGETKTPKCFSSARLAALKRKGKKGENIIRSAVRRKRQEDPGQQSKSGAAKPTNVKTFAKGKKSKDYVKPEPGLKEMAEKKDHEYSMARSQLSTVMSAAKRLKSKMGKGEGNIEAWVQSKITKAADYLDSAADYVDSGEMKVKEEFTTLPLEIEIPNNIRDFNLGLMFRESLDFNKGMLFVFDEVGEKSFYMKETKIPLDIAFVTEEGIVESIKKLEPYNETPVTSDGQVLYALEVNRGWFEENNVEIGDEIEVELNEAEKDRKGAGSGTKDACYHKVKSRYSVWPSAYASGALVKCRKKGAANWGNSTKKEETEIGEACWKGYEKKGMKTMFGKKYPNCVKKEEVQIESAEDRLRDRRQERGGVDGNNRYNKPVSNTPNTFGKKKPASDGMSALEKVKASIRAKYGDNALIDTNKKKEVSEAVRLPAKTGNLVDTYFMYRGRYFALKMFFPQTTMPRRSDVQTQIEKVYPGARLATFRVSTYEPGQPVLHAEGAAWTKKSGKNKEGGLNEKGRKSYEKENPGSDLKAPSKKVGNSRRASFCARMKGMKKKLTSKKTASDPDSRINKSLRAWNC
jgi:uncharacterized membrane protein (UPF0127 family)